MKPWELYELDLYCLDEMIASQIRKNNEEFDIKMQMLAWQTALLMNSSGNYKKRIKPSDLYSPSNDEEVEKQEKFTKEDVAEAKKKLQEDLLSTFADSNI